MGLDAELLDVLRRHCSSLGNSFVSQGSSRVLAQPSNQMLFAKTGAVDQVLGEAESLNAMYKASQAAGHSETLIPSIHAFGKTPSGSKAFLVTDYKNLSGGLSTSSQRILGTKLAEMHSNGTSDNGMYGFDRPTHCGATEQDNTWTASWSDFWTNRRIGDLVKRSGDKELAALEVQVREKVYPLLFNAKAMKNVRPAIIHGDLWSGNAGTDEQSGQPIIFDPSSSYSNNEAELGIMKMFGGFGSEFFDAYHKVLPKAEPYYEERQQMYEAYHHLNHFVMFGGGYRSGTVRIFKKLIAWADKEGSQAVGGGDDSGAGGGNGGGGGDGSNNINSGPKGLRGGNSQGALQSASTALPGCSSSINTHYPQDPPPGATGAAVASTSSTTLDAPTPLVQSAFPPATPSQIADYFSQMICYLWFSSGVPGHSMPSTPSRSPTSKHMPLQSSPLAPRRLPASSFTGPQSARQFRPTHAKTSSTGNLYQADPSTVLHSPDPSRDLQDELYSSSAAAVSKTIGNDPMLRRLQPKSKFLSFSREVLSTTQVSTSVITLALIYVHRLKAAHPHLKGRDGSEFRLAISSLMLANKILDDNTYLNKTWAEISGMPLIEISKMEVEFWLGLKMELHIGKDDYDRGLNEIQMLANDRNRAVLQRDAAVKRALQQQQTMAQSSQWMPYLQPGLSVSSDALTGSYESRFTSPLPPVSAQPPIRRSMGHFDAYLDSISLSNPHLPYSVPTPSYEFGSAMQEYSVQTPPYFARPSTFTLPPSPLSQASAGAPSTQLDGMQPGYQSGSLLHDTIASSPSHRTSLPFSYPGEQWPMWNQSSINTADGLSAHQRSSHSYEISPTNTSLTPGESYPWQSRPNLSTQSTSTLAGLKRDFEKTNLDASSPVGGGPPSSKRFAAEPTLKDDLHHYRLSSTSKQMSQSPTEKRYALRSRGRPTATATVLARGGVHRGNGRASASAASPIYPMTTSALPSPASQRSIQPPRSLSAHQDMALHPPHPNYHSVFTSALTPNALAAPLDNQSMNLYQPWSGSQAGMKRVAPLEYYSLAAGEPFGNIGTYMPPPTNARGYADAANTRRTSMRCNTRRDSSHQLGADANASAWSHSLLTPLSAPSFANGYTVQSKDDSSSSSRGMPPFSLDVNAWPLTNTASSNFLVPYHHLPPPTPSHTRSYQQHSHIS